MLNHATTVLCIGYLSESLSEAQVASLRHLLTQRRERISEQFDLCRLLEAQSVDPRIVFFLLPDEFCWALSCDLAEHVIPILLQKNKKDSRPQEILRARRQWLLGNATSAALQKANDCANELISDTVGDVCAMNVAGSLFNCVSITRQSSVAASSVSASALRAARLFELHQESKGAVNSWTEEGERTWQIAHVLQFLDNSLQFQDVTRFLKAELQKR